MRKLSGIVVPARGAASVVEERQQFGGDLVRALLGQEVAAVNGASAAASLA